MHTVIKRPKWNTNLFLDLFITSKRSIKFKLYKNNTDKTIWTCLMINHWIEHSKPYSCLNIYFWFYIFMLDQLQILSTQTFKQVQNVSFSFNLSICISVLLMSDYCSLLLAPAEKTIKCNGQNRGLLCISITLGSFHFCRLWQKCFFNHYCKNVAAKMWQQKCGRKRP